MAGTDAQEWQGRVGRSWAAEWKRTDRSFRSLTSELLARIGSFEFQSVLDVGCGAGELSLAVSAERPEARVLGIDLSPDLIDVARARVGERLNLEFQLADAAVWQPDESEASDLLISRHGVMFFDDPVSAFANLRAGAAPGAHLLFSCFRAVAANPFFGSVGALLPGVAAPTDPHAPGPFAFAEQERITSILSLSGWKDISCDPFDFRMIAGSGDDPVSDGVAYFSRIGPAARAISEMDGSARQAFKEKLAAFAQSHLVDGEVGLGAGVWIVSAQSD